MKFKQLLVYFKYGNNRKPKTSNKYDTTPNTKLGTHHTGREEQNEQQKGLNIIKKRSQKKQRRHAIDPIRWEKVGQKEDRPEQIQSGAATHHEVETRTDATARY